MACKRKPARGRGSPPSVLSFKQPARTAPTTRQPDDEARGGGDSAGFQKRSGSGEKPGSESSEDPSSHRRAQAGRPAARLSLQFESYAQAVEYGIWGSLRGHRRPPPCPAAATGTDENDPPVGVSTSPSPFEVSDFPPPTSTRPRSPAPPKEHPQTACKQWSPSGKRSTFGRQRSPSGKQQGSPCKKQASPSGKKQASLSSKKQASPCKKQASDPGKQPLMRPFPPYPPFPPLQESLIPCEGGCGRLVSCYPNHSTSTSAQSTGSDSSASMDRLSEALEDAVRLSRKYNVWPEEIDPLTFPLRPKPACIGSRPSYIAPHPTKPTPVRIADCQPSKTTSVVDCVGGYPVTHPPQATGYRRHSSYTSVVQSHTVTTQHHVLLLPHAVRVGEVDHSPPRCLSRPHMLGQIVTPLAPTATSTPRRVSAILPRSVHPIYNEENIMPTATSTPRHMSAILPSVQSIHNEENIGMPTAASTPRHMSAMLPRGVQPIHNEENITPTAASTPRHVSAILPRGVQPIHYNNENIMPTAASTYVPPLHATSGYRREPFAELPVQIEPSPQPPRCLLYQRKARSPRSRLYTVPEQGTITGEDTTSRGKYYSRSLGVYGEPPQPFQLPPGPFTWELCERCRAFNTYPEERERYSL